MRHNVREALQFINRRQKNLKVSQVVIKITKKQRIKKEP